MIKILRPGLVSICLLTALTSCKPSMKIEHLPYPETFRSDVTDNYFGVEVADPYRWLEDDRSEETAAWVAAENAVTQDYLSQIPYREAMRERLTELWRYPQESQPSLHGDYYYYYRNDGTQNQAVLYRKAALDAEGEVFLDPNALSEDGTVALSGIAFSKDGRYLAYSAAASGSDWVEIRVIDTETKQELSDVIRWVKFSTAVWAPDSKSFYYSAFDEPKEGMFSTKNEFQKVYHHKLGDDQSQDRLVYEDRVNPLRYFNAVPSSDGKWIFIHCSEGTSGAEILYARAGRNNFRTLLPGFEHDYEIVDCIDDRLYVHTNHDASNYRLVAIDLKNPERMEVVIPENDNLLEFVKMAGGNLLAGYLEKAQSKVYQYDMEGQLIREVELPNIGTATGFGGKEESTEVFYGLNTLSSPAAVYRYDLTTGVSTLYKQPEVAFDPAQFVTKQVFYPSKDGTQVSMFIMHRKDLEFNGQNPCYLYAYGGFQVNMTPSFNPSAILLAEQGGIYCVANLRGGSEYGEEWHKGGQLLNKQNVFDDFISAAEWLIANNYTSSEKLAIAGGSNGGLLVGACEVQRPDLYAVCLPAVGVLDMLRYHKFTIGWGWVVEYGSSDNEEQFHYIYKYSPLHNIREGVEYPATLVTTADHDDRVVPAHSFKFAAQMQYAQAGDAPILIRIDSKAGHGAGKPVSKRIDEAADVYSFLFWNTGTEYRPLE